VPVRPLLPVPTDGEGAAAPPAGAPPKGRAKAVKSYVASINHQPLPVPFVAGLLALEKTLRMPMWFIIQQGSPPGRRQPWEDMAHDIVAGFRASRYDMPPGKPIALLVDSPGGYAESAYTLARVLNTHCGRFTAVVPRYAKSAATLLTLGASALIV